MVKEGQRLSVARTVPGGLEMVGREGEGEGVGRVLPGEDEVQTINDGNELASPSATTTTTTPSSSLSLSSSSSSSTHNFHFLFIQMSEGVAGMLSLILAAGLGFIRKGYEKKHAKEFGGRKRLHAVSMCAGAVLLIPFLILYLISSSSSSSVPTDSSSSSSSTLSVSDEHSIGFTGSALTLVFLILFYVVLQFYVDAIGQRGDPQLLTQLNLIVSVLFAALIDWYRAEQRLSPATIAASVAIFFGVQNLVSHTGRRSDLGAGLGVGNVGMGGGIGGGGGGGSLPLYATGIGGAGGGGGSGSKTGLSTKELKVMIKHFLSDRTSMRIFIFLCINFTFMFVELIYGFYSNSLGLISDAGHMLFDCVALAIGLYASFVSKIKANSTYTYGYHRYEVLSGYVNGVFLLFIGYFVFVESIERLFRKDTHIGGDSLVVVSVLGLCVNMIGLGFFHDHHAGHGHSHGGGSGDDHHGHSHGGHGGGEGTNHNIFAIYLHILADTLGSVGVIISSLLVQYYNWTAADSVCSIIISLLIVGSVLPLLKSTSHILLGRNPESKDGSFRECLYRLSELDGVESYRDAHVWSFSDDELVGTLHVQVREDVDEQKMVQAITDLFKGSALSITNFSVQIEKNLFLQAMENETRGRGGIAS